MIVDRDNVFGVLQYIHYLYLIMLLVSAFAIIVARTIQNSNLGKGLSAIRDNEVAAESLGVPTLKLKLMSNS